MWPYDVTLNALTRSGAAFSGFRADSGPTEHGSSPQLAGGEQPGVAAASVSHRRLPAGDHQESSRCPPMRSVRRPQAASEILKLYWFNHISSQPANKLILKMTLD